MYIPFMRLPIQAAIYVVRPFGDSHQYLMLHRVLKQLTFWQGVTGGVESGETIDQTAARELIEETGFTTDDLQPIDYSYTFPADEFFRNIYEQPVDTITQHVYVARVPADSEPTIDSKEHDQYRWCSYEEALELLYWWDDKESIKRVEEFMQRHHDYM